MSNQEVTQAMKEQARAAMREIRIELNRVMSIRDIPPSEVRSFLQQVSEMCQQKIFESHQEETVNNYGK